MPIQNPFAPVSLNYLLRDAQFVGDDDILVTHATERSDTSNGPIARAPYCGKAFRARSWIDTCGLQKSVIVCTMRYPWRIETKICCNITNAKKV